MRRLRTRLAARAGAGLLATVTMDAAMYAAGEIGGGAWTSERLDPDVIGRWGRGLVRGRWRHVDASVEEPRHGDLAAGFLTHYGTGLLLTEAFLLLPCRRSMPAAVAFGIATSALPLLVLFPSLGYGVFGRHSGEAGRIVRIMLVGHAAFGLGIGIGSALLPVDRPA